MKVVVFAYSRQGCRTAVRLMSSIEKSFYRLYAPMRICENTETDPRFCPIPKPSADCYGEQFGWADIMIFVGSCGIAVREIAPHIKSKATDPAVLVIDELGQFCIPLLSGHIGGANAFAKAMAEAIGAIPVITTATDINHRFSVDAWAAKYGYIIGNLDTAKKISARILEQDVALYSEFPMIEPLPEGIKQIDDRTDPNFCGTIDLGIHIGYRMLHPFKETLSIIPRILHLGIGCRKGISMETVKQAVEQVLTQEHLEPRAVGSVASIDLKAEEEGLLAYCSEMNWPIRFYSAEELGRVPGDFTSSSFVQSVTGVDNVCERAALMEADYLIVKKTACNGVTVAVAVENLEVQFE